jgi:hypothetical protein
MPTRRGPKRKEVVRDNLRYENLGQDFVMLDKETILPTRLALHGVRLRIQLEWTHSSGAERPSSIKHLNCTDGSARIESAWATIS